MKLREIDVFTADCLRFLESLTSTFVEMSPLKYAVVRNAESLNPEIMCITPEKGAKLFKSLVDPPGPPRSSHTKRGGWYKHRVQAISCDGCYGQLFLKFNKRENRLDEFFFSDIEGLSDYPKLSKIIKMILVFMDKDALKEDSI